MCRVPRLIDMLPIQAGIASCRYMQRYAYDFVINVDTDEYFWLRSDFMRVPNPLQVCFSTCHQSCKQFKCCCDPMGR